MITSKAAMKKTETSPIKNEKSGKTKKMTAAKNNGAHTTKRTRKEEN